MDSVEQPLGTPELPGGADLLCLLILLLLHRFAAGEAVTPEPAIQKGGNVTSP